MSPWRALRPFGVTQGMLCAGTGVFSIVLFRTGSNMFGQYLISYILQQPFGWDFPTEPLFPSELINFADDREELDTLNVTPLRINDLRR